MGFLANWLARRRQAKAERLRQMEAERRRQEEERRRQEEAEPARRRQEETAKVLGVPVEKEVDLGGGVRMQLVLIPAGEFLMGSQESEDGRWDFEGQHLVRIAQPFYMGKYEVTQGQWQKVMGSNPSQFKGEDRLPVESVSWDDCQEFIKGLNAMGQGTFRLPTEAEWEYACRAGTTTPFHFGATISTDQANYDGNYTYGSGRKGVYRQKTTLVGSFPANGWGLHDMHGNVWEWTQTLFRDYPYSATDGRESLTAAGPRVLRGGNRINGPRFCRSAYRSWNDPAFRLYDGGVRVALSAQE